MIEQIHNQILKDLDRTARNDSIFVIGTVAFNFIAMSICWGMAGNTYSPISENRGDLVIFCILQITVVIFSLVTIKAMLSSEAMCNKYQEALKNMYEDHNVVKYLPKNMHIYSNQSNLLRKTFVSFSGILAVLIPLVDEFI